MPRSTSAKSVSQSGNEIDKKWKTLLMSHIVTYNVRKMQDLSVVVSAWVFLVNSRLLFLYPAGLRLRLAICLFLHFGLTVIMSRGKHGVPVSDRFRENWSLMADNSNEQNIYF